MTMKIGDKVRYIGEDHVVIKKNKVYEILDIKHHTYKVMTEVDETYYIHESFFEVVNEEEE